MAADDADDDEATAGVPPLPPEDRLWRHPSEVTSWGAGGAAPMRSGRSTTMVVSRSRAWPAALVGVVVGAATCGAALAVTGHLSPLEPERVVQKVAVTPVVSSPMLHGGSGVDALVDVVGPSVAGLVVSADEESHAASAVVVRDDGLLVTSAHEVVGATAIVVLLADGRRFEAALVGADLPTDVAVLAIDGDRLPVAVLGTSANLGAGTPTMAVGAGGGRLAVATGVVSALDRRLDADGESMHGMIQTDAPIERSWAGGPLVDATGAVVGISTGLAGEESAFGFATPIDLVRQVFDELVTWGTMHHAWLGVEGVDLTEAQAREIGVPGGVVVRSVVAGSPAEACGLSAGDTITELGVERVASSSALVVALRKLRPGDTSTIGYWRNGQHLEAEATLGERS